MYWTEKRKKMILKNHRIHKPTALHSRLIFFLHFHQESVKKNTISDSKTQSFEGILLKGMNCL